MTQYSETEIDEAYANYKALAKESHETGDWTIFPRVFTEDVTYKEAAFGIFHGRQAVSDWLVECQAPFPNDMVFPIGWEVFDYEAGAVVMEVYNRLVIPEKPDLKFDLMNWTRIEYGGDGLWRFEEDIYNPLEMRKVFDQWVAAGGKPRAPLMDMQHGAQ